MPTKEIVVLLHCLAGSPLCMFPIEKNLYAAGYQVLNIGYPSRKKDIFALAEHVYHKILPWCNLPEIRLHFVTYSLGGIILRVLLNQNTLSNGGRAVMLVPPNQGSPVADQLKNNFFFKWFLGPAAQQLGTDLPLILPTAQQQMEIGIIAGSKHYLSLFNSVLPEPNDGLLSVEHTIFSNMSDHLVIPTSHLFIIFHQEVMRQIRWFLKNGKFKREKYGHY